MRSGLLFAPAEANSHATDIIHGVVMTDQPDLRGLRTQEDDVVVSLTEYRQSRDPVPVTFHRRELDAILRIYGRMVGEGEWKDYAIDH